MGAWAVPTAGWRTCGKAAATTPGGIGARRSTGVRDHRSAPAERQYGIQCTPLGLEQDHNIVDNKVVDLAAQATQAPIAGARPEPKDVVLAKHVGPNEHDVSSPVGVAGTHWNPAENLRIPRRPDAVYRYKVPIVGNTEGLEQQNRRFSRIHVRTWEGVLLVASDKGAWMIARIIPKVLALVDNHGEVGTYLASRTNRGVLVCDLRAISTASREDSTPFALLMCGFFAFGPATVR